MTEPFTEYTLDQIPAGEHLREWERHDWTLQEEKFAREYLRSGDRIKALVTGFGGQEGVTRATLHNRSRNLLFQPWMQDYLEFCRERQRELMKRTADDVLDEITKLAKSNIVDFLSIDGDGTPYYDLSGLTREQSAAIQELQIDTYTVGRGDFEREVRSIKMKLAPKTPALELLGKNQKLFTDVLAHENVGDEIEELRRARERMRKARPEDGQGDDDDEHAVDDGQD